MKRKHTFASLRRAESFFHTDIIEEKESDASSDAPKSATPAMVIRTVLLTKELNDLEVDMCGVNDSYFSKMNISQLHQAFTMLKTMIRPVFSGSIDHRINLLDLWKLKKTRKE
jgi:hypothetical protein